jgi:phosphomannomutase
MLAGLLMLERCAELHAEGKTLSEALRPFREKYIESGEVNFQLPPDRTVAEAVEEAVEQFSDEAERLYVVTEDGCERVKAYPPADLELDVPDVRFEAEDWWFCMRRSGTEAREGEILRLYVEAVGDRELMEEKRDALVELVGPELRM